MTHPDKTTPAPKLIPAGSARTEIRASNSRFIATAAPSATVEAARAFIAGVRAEMPDASHHIYAYIVGHGATTTLSMTDDGEPPGTAGRPVMAVLKGSGLGDVALVITRYFGGTLLGTGGLPRAEKIDRRDLSVTLPYAAYEPARRLIAAHAGSILEETFAADVTLRVSVPIAEVAAFAAEIAEATAGQIKISDSL